ncbi:MAG: type I 3-dehydroquinate dehydratase [Candidatus Methanoperedens sp.]|nr:type I 3-dehydroquinate dehydratase [Candidatus Methanoperedens sp.]
MAFPSNRSVVAPIAKDPVNTSIKAKYLGADILELRIDLINEDPFKILIELKKLGLPVIITNRMKKEGGAWQGSEEERIHELISLIQYADIVDIELCAEKKDLVINEAKRAGKKVIISTHDFQDTPDNEVMAGFIRESFEAGADIAKIAVMPHSLDDVLRLLDVTLHSSGQVCTIAMGEIGKHSRIMAPLYGSVMTYGYVDIPVAPGQLRVDELKNMLQLL